MSSLVVEPGNTDRGAFTNFGSVNDATNGLKMIDGAADAASAFSRGDWVEGAVNGVSAAIDVVGMILNPLAGAVSMVVNWIMEHVGPIQDWLDQLLGDPGTITAGAASWTNIGQHLAGVGEEYRSLVSADLSGYTGLTVDAYRGFAGTEADIINGLSQISHGVSGGIEVAGGLLAGVRDFMQGLFSDLIGAAVDAAAKAVMTLGIAAPACLAGLIAKAKNILERCRTFMKALSRSLDKMADLLGKISPAMESATKNLSKFVVEGASQPVEVALNFGLSMGKGTTGINNPG